VAHPSCAESAVVGISDDVTGQAIVAFCTAKATSFAIDSSGVDKPSAGELQKDLVLQVRKVIGPFAAPKRVIVVPELPKTRSGKIMRRILRKIASDEVDQLGDTSTLADPAVINHLIEAWKGKK
jgi:acetyl-CoA synthetase